MNVFLSIIFSIITFGLYGFYFGYKVNKIWDDIKKFEEENLKNKKWNIKLIGSKDKIKLEEFKKYGKVVELSMKDIFGYDVESTVKP